MHSEFETSLPLIERLLVETFLFLTFVATFFLGFLTTYLIGALGLAIIVYLVVRRRDFRWRLDRMSTIFLVAFLILVFLFAITATTPANVDRALNFAAFLLYAPLAILLSHNAAKDNAARVATFALVGAALAAAIAVVQVGLLSQGRAAGFNSDTIRFANTAVIFGFLAMMGFHAIPGPWRFLFLLGPVFAFVVAILTGARVAILAYPVLATASLLLTAPRRLVWSLVVGLVLTLIAVGLLVEFSGNQRFDSLVTTINQIASGQGVTDPAVAIRLEIYRAGWQSFLQSPIIGHGYAHMMSSLAPFLPENEQWYTGYPHLHNEFLNFAVFGGLVGVAIYIVLLIAPVWLVLRSPRDSQRQQRIFASVVIAIAYFMMGLTDTMVSFELHTAFYVALTAIVLTYCRDGKVPPSPA